LSYDRADYSLSLWRRDIPGETSQCN